MHWLLSLLWSLLLRYQSGCEFSFFSLLPRNSPNCQREMRKFSSLFIFPPHLPRLYLFPLLQLIVILLLLVTLPVPPLSHRFFPVLLPLRIIDFHISHPPFTAVSQVAFPQLSSPIVLFPRFLKCATVYPADCGILPLPPPLVPRFTLLTVAFSLSPSP